MSSHWLLPLTHDQGSAGPFPPRPVFKLEGKCRKELWKSFTSLQRNQLCREGRASRQAWEAASRSCDGCGGSRAGGSLCRSLPVSEAIWAAGWHWEEEGDTIWVENEVSGNPLAFQGLFSPCVTWRPSEHDSCPFTSTVKVLGSLLLWPALCWTRSVVPARLLTQSVSLHPRQIPVSAAIKHNTQSPRC